MQGISPSGGLLQASQFRRVHSCKGNVLKILLRVRFQGQVGCDQKVQLKTFLTNLNGLSNLLVIDDLFKSKYKSKREKVEGAKNVFLYE